jgi:hypothetical protein
MEPWSLLLPGATQSAVEVVGTNLRCLDFGVLRQDAIAHLGTSARLPCVGPRPPGSFILPLHVWTVTQVLYLEEIRALLDHMHDL